MDKAALRIGAIAFIHRFGLNLNGHVNFHVCAVDRVFLGVTDDNWTSGKVGAFIPLLWRILLGQRPLWSTGPQYRLLVDCDYSLVQSRCRKADIEIANH